jgi:hypothetical protein
MKKQIIAVAAILTLGVSSAAIAGDIYKWVDEDGNVHYGDKPTGNEPERMAIASQPTDNARVQQQIQVSTTARTQRREAEAAAAAEGPSKEELQAEAQERAQRCQSARATMQSFITSRRLYREDESGERVYLDESETIAARQRVEDQIDEYCGS